jgi:hypothetical protein
MFIPNFVKISQFNRGHRNIGVLLFLHRETILQQGDPGRTHKAYFPIAPTSSPTCFVLLMLYFGDVSS